MGLLDSVLGAVMNNSNASSGEGGLGSLIGMVTNNPQVMQAITGLLGNDGEHGGLGGLIAKFQQAGLGEVVGSWVGKGENLPVSADQISSVLDVLEKDRAQRSSAYWFGPQLGHADIAVAVCIRFVMDAHPGVIALGGYPALQEHAARLEALPVFQQIQQPFRPSA